MKVALAAWAIAMPLQVEKTAFRVSSKCFSFSWSASVALFSDPWTSLAARAASTSIMYATNRWHGVRMYKNNAHSQSSGRIFEPDSVTRMPYFLKFSIIRRRFETTSTRPIKFRKPRKEGALSASWLKHEVRAVECTAKVCLYCGAATLACVFCDLLVSCCKG